MVGGRCIICRRAEVVEVLRSDIKNSVLGEDDGNWGCYRRRLRGGWRGWLRSSRCQDCVGRQLRGFDVLLGTVAVQDRLELVLKQVDAGPLGGAGGSTGKTTTGRKVRVQCSARTARTAITHSRGRVWGVQSSHGPGGGGLFMPRFQSSSVSVVRQE